MTDSTPFAPGSPLSDPLQAILGRLDLLLEGQKDFLPLLDMLNTPELDPVRSLASLLQTLTEATETLEVATRQLPDLLAVTEARLTALEMENARRHAQQMKLLDLLLRQFDAVV